MNNEEIQSFLDDQYEEMERKEKGITTYRIADAGPPWMGACLSTMVHQMNCAYYYNHKFGMSANDSWRMSPTGKFSEVFASLSEINDDDFEINNFNSKYNRISYNKHTDRIIHFTHKKDEIGFFYPKKLETIVNSTDIRYLNSIWKSFLLKKIFVLQPKYIELVNQKINKISLLENYAAIHIRRGDKVAGPLKESNLIPIINYFTVLENSNYEFDCVFIATDSQEALQQTIQLYGNKYHLIYDGAETRHDGYPLKVLDKTINEKLNADDELLTALKNFQILKNSKVLVGTIASWFFRISMLLKPYDQIYNILYAEQPEQVPGYEGSYWLC